MSGRKRIQVDESEWYRIQRKAQQLKEVQRNIPKLIDGVRQQTRADLDRVFAGVEQRQQQHDAMVRCLSEQTRQLEADTARRLREQADELHGVLAETAGQIRDETRQRLAEQHAQVRQEIAAERARRRAETARLSAEIDLMKADRTRAGQTVRTWLSDARAMAGALTEAGLHERYAPGELDRLTGRLATAEQNAAQGRFDAALAVAQETYHSLSELRADIEQRELERCTAQLVAVDALVAVETEIEGSRVQPVLGPDGVPLAGCTVDVGHWSDGELDQLRQETGDGLARARDDRTGTDELRALREQEAPRLEAALGDTVGRATMRHLASQIRVNLADAVAQTLSEFAHYDFVDGEYENADQRGAYYAKLRHENGNEIVLDISQAARDSGQHVVRVLSYDYDTTAEAQLQDRAEAISRALDGEGHAVSAPVSEPGTPDPAMLDIEAHRAPGRAEQARGSTGQPRHGTGGV
ncbi:MULTISPECIES: hypothetical protein [unclassified Streptomyces]|uniref:hypothetical protein n=1 Tax=unclassified Streptomyces TaxID=2593676 RepID=UPI0035DDEDA2